MSLKSTVTDEIPVETVRIACAAFPKGNTIMRLRDAYGTLYDDADFAALFPKRGQPALAPWRLALVTVFQHLENLTDRQAADQVRARIDWKYALGLELSDDGFDFSVLSEFRSRLLTGKVEQLLLDKMLSHFVSAGLIKAGGKQRTDSTHVLANIRQLNHLELVAEALRAALNEVATYAPEWLSSWVPTEFFQRYSRPVFDFRLPKGKTARDEYAVTVGEDGFSLLEAVRTSNAPAELNELPGVQSLRTIWAQHFEIKRGKVRLRDGPELPPGAQRLVSPYETEARVSTKRGITWIGYKAHLTETCDDDQVRLITHVMTTPAPMQDVRATDAIQEELKAQELLPSQHIVDSGYVDAGLLLSSQQKGVALLGPPRPNSSWQAKTAGAFTVNDFQIDWDNEIVTCPNGKQSNFWQVTPDRYERPAITVHFRQSDCLGCVQRERCTRAAARNLKLHPREVHEALQRVLVEGLGSDYALRSGIEGTIAQSTRSCGLRRCRYRGLTKTHLQHVCVAAAINISRITNWLAGQRYRKSAPSRFAALNA